MIRMWSITLTVFGTLLGSGWAEEPKTLGPDPSTFPWTASPSQSQTDERAYLSSRESAFNTERVRLARILASLETAIAREEQRSIELVAAFDTNNEAIAMRETQLINRRGSIDEVLGVLQQVAGTNRRIADRSIITVQFPERADAYDQFGRLETVPSVDDLTDFWALLLQDLIEQSRVVQFDADVERRGGAQERAAVTRYGPFTAYQGSEVLRIAPGGLSFAEFERPASIDRPEPSGAQAAAFNMVTLDPARGAILSTFSQIPTTEERVRQGGIAGAVVIVVGVLGGLFGLLRVGQLLLSRRRAKGMPADPENRVAKAMEERLSFSQTAADEAIENAYFRESDRLEAGLADIKTLARMAPLIGLLGSVIGMIATFKALSYYGTGDPQRMADGISEALVSTMLGIICAVFLVLLHRLLSSISADRVHALRAFANGLLGRERSSQ